MRQIILVKHASPSVQPGISSDRWPLSPGGRAAAEALIPSLTPFGGAAVISSNEPKAVETAKIVASGLGLGYASHEGLHEHERRTVPHLRTADFLSLMAQVFRRKEEVVLGEESAAAALRRFTAAVNAICSQHPDGNLILVTHGTVIALFLESVAGQDGYKVWREMGLPSYAVLEQDAGGWKLVQVMPKVGAAVH